MRIVILLGSVFVLSLPSYAQTAVGGAALITPVTRENQVFGKPLNVTEQAETVPSGQGIVTTTGASFAGHSKTLVDASVEAIPSQSPPSTIVTTGTTTSGGGGGITVTSPPGTIGPTGTTITSGPVSIVLGDTNLYIGGVKIWTGALTYKNGVLAYSGGVAPTQIPFTLFVYPVGPMTLEVDAGVSFEGSITASLTPGLSYPLQDSELDAKLSADMSAGGFIDGYANLWLLRAGVGGQVNIIDGTVGVTGRILLNGHAPVGSGSGSVRMLNGELYGFVDDRFLFGVWSRLYTKNFYSWSGYCFSFDSTACAGIK
jgi:hypothetical protein